MPDTPLIVDGRPWLHHGPWTVYLDEERLPDRALRTYTARHGLTGETHVIDVSYSAPAHPETIRGIIDLGFPTRRDVDSIGPLLPEHVIAMLRAELAQAVAA